MGLVRADTEAELRALQAGDPALKIGMHHRSHLMPRLVFRDARG